jgi:predicted metal-binding membrane protein
MVVAQERLTPKVHAPRALGSGRRTARPLGLWLGAAGWMGMAAMWVTGSADVFGHDQAARPALIGVGLFLSGWLVMVAAMMLPSSLPTFGRLDRILPATASRAMKVMLGYFSAWAAFGAAAFAGDGILHRIVESLPWLAARPSLVVGGLAIFAGSAELLGRTPPALMPAVRAGMGPIAVGRTHAIDRIRRCWPLMLFTMAVGMSSPFWMVSLTGAMALELRPGAEPVLRLVGLAILLLGIAVVIQPDWVPAVFGVAAQG